MKNIKILLIVILFFACFLPGRCLAQAGVTINVQGANIVGPSGDVLLLRGVNYAPYNWGYSASELKIHEIGKTKANAIRIVWYMNAGNPNANLVYSNMVLLDTVLSQCIQNKIIPILELHDQTCQNSPSSLINLANWYTQSAVKNLITKYQHSIIINIANEALHIDWASNPALAQSDFISTYNTCVSNIRNAGIKVPLMIDASECGTNLNKLSNVAATLQNADVQHNLIFSAHAYWQAYSSMDSATIRTMIVNAKNLQFPFVFGEIANQQDDASPCQYNLNYRALLNICQELQIGWLAWSWDHDQCVNRQITTNGLSSSLSAYGNDILNNATYGVNTVSAPKSQYLLNIAALPITFETINAVYNNEKLVVNFTTTAEKNIAFFSIEVSKDGNEFIEAARILPKTDNTDLVKEYVVNINSKTIVSLLFFPTILLLFSFYNKRKMISSILSFFCLGLIYLSCTNKKESILQSDQKIFVRITAVDRDGTTKSSKIIQSITE